MGEGGLLEMTFASWPSEYDGGVSRCLQRRENGCAGEPGDTVMLPKVSSAATFPFIATR